MDKLMEFLQKEVPTNAEKLILSLNLCIKNIDSIRSLLRDKSIELQKYDDRFKLEQSVECINANKMLLDLKENLERYVNYIEVPSVELLCDNVKIIDDINENDIELNNLIDEKCNDDDISYLVDQTIPYALSEKLRNTKPCAFSYKGTKFYVSSYNKMLLKLCEILYNTDKKLFESMASLNKISSNKKSYIVHKGDVIAKYIITPIPLLDTDIIIEATTNTPQKVDIMLRLLEIYKISPSVIKVYLRKDENPKHGFEPIGKYLNRICNSKRDITSHNAAKNISNIPASQLAYNYFQDFYKDTDKYYDITNFLSKEWCNKTFSIPYPIFKRIDNTRPLKEQTFTEDKNYPHYAQGKQVIINGEPYVIYMLWNTNLQKIKLEKWINEHPIDKKEQFDSNNTLYNDSRFNQLSISDDLLKYYPEQLIYIISKQQYKTNCCPRCGLKTEGKYLTVKYTKTTFLYYKLPIAYKYYIVKNVSEILLMLIFIKHIHIIKI